MPIDIIDMPQPVILLARGYTREESIPFPAYPSGAVDKDNPIYTYPTSENTNPLMLLEEDIIGSDGRGLRKGFYEVRPDAAKDFLLLYQSGKLKAKAPIISIEQRKQVPPVKTKIKKGKRIKKNYRGTNPEDFIYQHAEIFRDEQQGCYIIIWDRANTRIRATLKLQ